VSASLVGSVVFLKIAEFARRTASEQARLLDILSPVVAVPLGRQDHIRAEPIPDLPIGLLRLVARCPADEPRAILPVRVLLGRRKHDQRTRTVLNQLGRFLVRTWRREAPGLGETTSFNCPA